MDGNGNPTHFSGKTEATRLEDVERFLDRERTYSIVDTNGRFSQRGMSYDELRERLLSLTVRAVYLELLPDEIVIDVDRHGDIDGFIAIEPHLEILNDAACVVTTPNIGKHFYFKLSSDVATKMKADSFPGVDFLRSVAGKQPRLVGLPGSLHKDPLISSRYVTSRWAPNGLTTLPPVFQKAIKTERMENKSKPAAIEPAATDSDHDDPYQAFRSNGLDFLISMMVQHGYQFIGEQKGQHIYLRPGKQSNHAESGRVDRNGVISFSSNDPLYDNGNRISLVEAYRRLNGVEYDEVPALLANDGFGKPILTQWTPEDQALLAPMLECSDRRAKEKQKREAALTLGNHTQQDAPYEWLVSAEQLIRERKPTRWLVKGWIPEKGLGMLFGPSGCGKTFVMLDICLRMACGLGDWFGHKVSVGTVAYLLGEGHDGVTKRIKAWEQENKVDSTEHRFFASKSACDINRPEGLAYAVSYLEKLPAKPQLIVVDTLHRFLEGEENGTADAKTMINACNELTRMFGCTVMLIHHTGNAQDAQTRARGSSAFKGAMDTEIFVAQLPRGGMRVRQTKSKESAQAKSIHLKLAGVPIEGWFDEDGDQETSAIVVKSKPPKKKAAPEDVKSLDAGVKKCNKKSNPFENGGQS